MLSVATDRDASIRTSLPRLMHSSVPELTFNNTRNVLRYQVQKIYSQEVITTHPNSCILEFEDINCQNITGDISEHLGYFGLNSEIPEPLFDI